MSTNNTEPSSEQANEFKLELGSREKGEVSKFDHLADNTLTCLVNHGNHLNELYHIKDELLQYSLPPSFLMQVLLVASRISRSFSDVSVLVHELIRLIQQYSVPWEEKGEVLKKLRNDYMAKQNQLSIAIRHLEMASVEAERMKQEKRLNLWMRLYMKTMSTKSTGRRWRFRIEPFKKKIAEGFNPYESDSDSEKDDMDANKHRLTPSDVDEDELRDLASEKASEISQALSSRLGIAAALKKVQFAGFEESDHPPSSPTEQSSRPHVETHDASTWTSEPEYTYYLMIVMYRPRGFLRNKDITCTITLSDHMHTSKVFTPAQDTEEFEVFRFCLSDEDASYLPLLLNASDKETDLYLTPKISIAIYPNNIANDMAGHCSILLPKLSLNGTPITVVPPISNIEDKPDSENNEAEHVPLDSASQLLSIFGSQTETAKSWEPDWESFLNQVMIADPEPVVYPVKLLADQVDNDEDDDPDDSPPCVPLVCQIVKIQRHHRFEVGLNTQHLESLVKDLGYKKLADTITIALSALMLDPSRATTPDKEPSMPEVPQIEEEEKMSAAEVAQLTLQHAEELKQLQDQYNNKLQVLSRTLAKVKSEKQKEIEMLEEALLQSEAKSQHRKRSPSELRELLARKKRLNKLAKGLPEWGKNLPDNFFERLELFAHESMRKNAEMTERIKREVKEVCEKQLNSLHKLAPNIMTNPDSAVDDVCIPALFMPTPSSRPVVFNPRAHNYFHPPGSEVHRVSQPPAVFKLPPLQTTHLSTMNLYELSQRDFTRTGPVWLRGDQSMSYTPAPPPSACDYYLPPPTDRKYNQPNGDSNKQYNN